ncbi:MAG: hypothetical protein LUH22_09875 [Bacteroides sp.]|nr:hypothetical protein [Bacteroides sp.]
MTHPLLFTYIRFWRYIPLIAEIFNVTVPQAGWAVSAFMLSLFHTTTGKVFSELLSMTISMEDVNSNEKFYRLSQSLPGATANPGTIHTRDLMAYEGDGLVLFYKTFSTT